MLRLISHIFQCKYFGNGKHTGRTVERQAIMADINLLGKKRKIKVADFRQIIGPVLTDGS